MGYKDAFGHAETVIKNCLEAKGKPSDHASCIYSTFETCEDEHGTSQRALTECAHFLQAAWEKRLGAARGLLMGAKTFDARSEPAEPMVEIFAASERRWDDWNEADCEMQAKLSEGGSIHPMEKSLCMLNHAAHRAIELEYLVRSFGKVFRLPNENGNEET